MVPAGRSARRRRPASTRLLLGPATLSLEISSRSSGKLYYSRRGSITSRNGKRLKSVSRVLVGPMPRSRIRMVVCASWSRLPARCGNSKNNLFGNVGVALCRYKNRETGRGEKRRNEIPGRRCTPRPSHDARVGCHAQKLIEDRPGGVPSIRSHPLALEPVAAGGMKLRVRIGGIDQHTGVDGEH